jgi:hypothetical protein
MAQALHSSDETAQPHQPTWTFRSQDKSLILQHERCLCERFSVNVSENYWHCFACDIGGSIIHFYMRWHGVEYQDAVTELAEMLL